MSKNHDIMRPERLERHLITYYPGLKDKPIELFHAKINLVKRVKLDSTGHFQMENEKVMEASYESNLVDS